MTAKTTEDITDELALLSGDELERAIELLKEKRDEENRESKEEKNKKEVEQLWKDLDSGNLSTQKAKVAFLLNNYRDTRNSDVTLTLRYWQMFQSDIYNPSAIEPKNLFKLERFTIITRLRAKIQNDYGLFLAKEEIRNKRRQKEIEVKDYVIEDVPVTRNIHVYADESGKTGKFIIFGAVWVLDPRSAALIQNEVNDYRARSGYRREFHFSEVKPQAIEHYQCFVDIAAKHLEYIGFKAVYAALSGTGRKPDEAVRDMAKLLLINGIEDEISSGRVSPPRVLNVTVDNGTFLDDIGREQAKLDVSHYLESRYGRECFLERFAEYDSKHSAMLQLADLFCGAVNRKINQVGDARNHKDELADYIVGRLSPVLSEQVDSDSVRVIRLGQ